MGWRVEARSVPALPPVGRVLLRSLVVVLSLHVVASGIYGVDVPVRTVVPGALHTAGEHALHHILLRFDAVRCGGGLLVAFADGAGVGV